MSRQEDLQEKTDNGTSKYDPEGEEKENFSLLFFHFFLRLMEYNKNW